jgi:hypothetical protein
MQNPTSIPTGTVVAINSLNLNRTFTVRRKAAKRSERWYQNTAAPLSLPARKKPRLEESPSTDTVAASTLRQSSRCVNTPSSASAPAPAPPTDTANAPTLRRSSRQIQLLPTETSEEELDDDDAADGDDAAAAAADDDDNNDASTDSVTDTQPNGTGRWTPEEDVKLTSAVTNTCKKKCGKKHRIDWVAVAMLVPHRTRKHCYRRWYRALDPSIDRANGRTGTWAAVEDIKLKAAVQKHGGKSWNAITSLVPGRTKEQCNSRWRNALDPSIDRTNGRTGKWEEDEDIKLKAAVKTHGGKSWDEIAALIPGRTKIQCNSRWNAKHWWRTGATGQADGKELEIVASVD